MKRVVPFLLIVALFTLTACGGGEEAPPPAEPTATATAAASVPPIELNAVLNDIHFGETNDNQANPPVWTVTSGAEVTVKLDNRSTGLQHNWSIAKLGEEVPSPFVGGEQLDVVLAGSETLNAGQSGDFVFTAPLPGEYTVLCTVAGHYPVMQGKLVVEAGS